MGGWSNGQTESRLNGLTVRCFRFS